MVRIGTYKFINIGLQAENSQQKRARSLPPECSPRSLKYRELQLAGRL